VPIRPAQLPGPSQSGWAALVAAFFCSMGRAIVYVDGFNLYYGAVRWTPRDVLKKPVGW